MNLLSSQRLKNPLPLILGGLKSGAILILYFQMCIKHLNFGYLFFLGFFYISRFKLNQNAQIFSLLISKWWLR